jgi:cell division protein FtsQ
MSKAVIQLLSGMIFITLTAWFGWQEIKAQGADWLPVKYVRIEGAFQYIAKEKIKQVITAQVKNGLYNVNVQQIQSSVKELPWVKKVDIKQVWPDAINITIKEQVPVVRWGKKNLLNNKGQKFTPDKIQTFEQLPVLNGPDGSEARLLVSMNKMSDALMKQDMKLIEFRVNERRSWQLILDNTIEVILGTNEQEKRFKRFLKTFALIGKEQIKKVAVVDLRYANGYTLRWKQGKEKIDWEQVVVMNRT